MLTINRRTMLMTAAVTTISPAARKVAAQTPSAPPDSWSGTDPSYPFVLPPLPYASSANEPHIDAQTMELHHDKHHAAYVANLNAALKGHSQMHGDDADAASRKAQRVARRHSHNRSQ